MCFNFQWEPTERQRRSTLFMRSLFMSINNFHCGLHAAICMSLLQTPPSPSDFEQWIDTEIKEFDRRLLECLKEWDAERREAYERRLKEEAAEKECKKEEERRKVTTCMEEREKKLERVR